MLLLGVRSGVDVLSWSDSWALGLRGSNLEREMLGGGFGEPWRRIVELWHIMPGTQRYGICSMSRPDDVQPSVALARRS